MPNVARRAQELHDLGGGDAGGEGGRVSRAGGGGTGDALAGFVERGLNSGDGRRRGGGAAELTYLVIELLMQTGVHVVVRQAYFLGAADPYKALKTTLRAEIDAEAWATLNSDVSRPFDKPKTGRIAVKVINHLGDEVMKVFGVA